MRLTDVAGRVVEGLLSRPARSRAGAVRVGAGRVAVLGHVRAVAPGDRLDLAGGHAKRRYKLPNPAYLIT